MTSKESASCQRTTTVRSIPDVAGDGTDGDGESFVETADGQPLAEHAARDALTAAITRRRATRDALRRTLMKDTLVPRSKAAAAIDAREGRDFTRDPRPSAPLPLIVTAHGTTIRG
jgi:hypothetical protein